MHVLHFFIVTSTYIYNMTVTKMSVPILFTYCVLCMGKGAKRETKHTYHKNSFDGCLHIRNYKY